MKTKNHIAHLFLGAFALLGILFLGNSQLTQNSSIQKVQAAGCPAPGTITGDYTIDTSCTLVPGTYTITGNLTIGGGSPITVTVQGNTAATPPTHPGVVLDVAGNITTLANATISGNGQGYVPAVADTVSPCGFGTFPAVTNVGHPISGHNCADPMSPARLGGAGSYSTAVASFGAGGGALKMIAGGTLTHDGTITMNGQNASTAGFNQLGVGGGAGGSVWLQSGILAGAGTVSTKGGNFSGAAANFVGSSGGFGGRISIDATTSTYTGVLNTQGGDAQGSRGDGQDGTIVYMNKSMPSVYTASNPANGCPLPGTYASAVTIDTNCQLLAGSYTFQNDLTIGTGSAITVRTVTDYNTTGFPGPNMTVTGNMTVAANAILSADRRGHGLNIGTGTTGISNGGPGGTHCGIGGNSGLALYGSYTNPTTLGSSGAQSANPFGGQGGGALKCTVDGTLTVNGIISADGGYGDAATFFNGSSGGGSGGSLNINANTVTGNGIIRSNGGGAADCPGCPANRGGGGGGGYVTLIRQTNSFLGTLAAAGGDAVGTDGAACTPVSAPSICGNSVIENTEECDDGNIANNDGCSDMCTIDVCFTTPVGLVQYWSLNGHYINEAGNTDAVPVNGASFTTLGNGKAGKAISLDGADDYVDVGNQTATNNISISAWIRPTGFGSGGLNSIYGGADASGNNASVFGIYNSGTQLVWDVYLTGATRRAWKVDYAFATNQWYHVAVTQSGGPGVAPSIYINGVAQSVTVAISAGGVPTYSSQPHAIGRFGGYASQYYFGGRIDEVQVYNVALSGTAITNIYNAQTASICGSDADSDGVRDAIDACPGSTGAVNAAGCDTGECFAAPTGLNTWWKMNESSGTSLGDSAGTRTGTIAGTVNFSTGKIGNALTFNGTNTGVTSSDVSIPSGNGSRSFSVWAKFPTSGHDTGGNYLWNYGTASGNSWLGLFLNGPSGGPGPNGTVGTTTWVTNMTTGAGTTNIFDNTWHHITYTYDGTGTKHMVYVDGSPIGGQTATALTTALNGTFYFGNYALSQFTNVSLDDFQIYNKALSQKEVLAIVSSDSAGLCTPVCGNNITEATETCDDGNAINDDGCGETCAVEVCADTAANRVGYWKAENNANDATGSGNTGTVIGATYAAGKVGQAFSFDGTDDYVKISDSDPDWNFGSNDFALSAWVKTSTSNGLSTIFSNRNALAQTGILVATTATQVQAYVGGAGWPALTSTTNIVDNTWHHVAVTRNGSTFRLYIDGQQQSTATYSGSIGADARMWIGSDLQAFGGPSPTAFWFNGLIDEATVYNRGLLGSEVQQLYNKDINNSCVPFSCGNGFLEASEDCDDGNNTSADGCSATCTNEVCVAAPTGLQNLWTGNSTFVDSVGNAHGFVKDGATFGPGKVGSAFELDGLYDYVEIPTVSSLQPTGSFSVSAWIKPDALANYKGVFSRTISSMGAQYTYMYVVHSDGSMAFYTPSNNWNHTAAGVISAGVWTHVTWVYNGSQILMYANGVLKSTASATILNNYPTHSNHIGAWDATTANYYFDGKIDDVQYYNTALTLGNIQTIYNNKSGGVCAADTDTDGVSNALDYCPNSSGAVNAAGCSSTTCSPMPSSAVRHYPLNASSGTTAVNAFGDNNGTLTNMAGTEWATISGRQGITFDGVNDYIAASDANLPSGAQSRTISLWFRTAPGYNTFNRYMLSYGTNVAGQAVGLGINYPSTNQIVFSNASSNYSSPVLSITDGNWHHLLVTYEGITSQHMMYVDGVQVASAVFAMNTILTGSSLNIGQYPTAPFAGTISDVYIYSTALTETEARAFYYATTYGMCSPTCGDSNTNGNEQCDDGNLVGNDGCSSTCQIEVCENVYPGKHLWKGENNALDEAGTANGTVSGAVYATGQVGQGFSFDGINDVVNLGTNATPSGTLPFSLSGWIKTTDASAPIARNRDLYNYGQAFFFDIGLITPGHLGFSTYPSSVTLNSLTPVNDNIFHFFTLTRATDGLTKLYIDGVLHASATGAPLSLNGLAEMGIGGDLRDFGIWLQGIIDEFAVWNRDLTQAEIQQLYNASATGAGGFCEASTCGNFFIQAGEQCDDGNIIDGDGCSSTCQTDVCQGGFSGTVGSWNGNGNANDTSSYGNNGTLTNGATATATGKVGQAFSLDGVDDYVYAPDANSLDLTTTGTVSAWVNPTTVTLESSTNRRIVSKGGTLTTNIPYDLFVDTSGFINLRVSNGTTAQLVTSPSVVPLNTWTHVVAVWDTSNIQIFVNGILQQSVARTITPLVNTQPLHIGNGLSTGRWSGLIDEVRIHNVALTQAQIQSLYLNGEGETCIADICGNSYQLGSEECDDGNLTNGDGCSSTCTVDQCVSTLSSLRGWWNLDETAASGTLIDQTGLHNGTLGGVTTSGKVSTARQFSSNFASIPTSTDFTLDNTKDLTIETWVMRTGASATHHILGVRSVCDASPFNYQLIIDPALGFVFGSTLGSVASGSAFYPLQNVWYHVVVTSDNGVTKLYVNGVLTGTATLALVVQNAPLVLGTAATSGTCGIFPGKLDEVKIYNTALTQGQITAAYESQSAGTCALACGDGILTGSEQCDDGNTLNNDGCSSTCTLDICSDDHPNAVGIFHAENNLTDSSGNANIGTFNSGATYATGKSGQGFSLDGVNDNVTLGNSSYFNVGDVDWSANVWFLPDPDQVDQMIFTKHVAGSANGFFVAYNPSTINGYFTASNLHGIGIGFGGSGGSQWFYSTRADLNDGAWHHLAVTFNAATNQIKFYIDGVLDSTFTASNGVASAAPLALGGVIQGGSFSTSTPGGPFKGGIDEFSFFNVLLTADQVGSLYFYGDGGACSNSTPDPVMGNGIVEGGEECDDGNLTNGDGCSSTGVLENVGYCPTPGTISGDKTISGNCTLIPGTYVFTNNLTVGGSGAMTLTMQSNPAAVGFKGVDLQVQGNLTVNADATIKADGQGATAQTFPALNPCGTAVSSDYENAYEAGYGGMNCGSAIEPTSLGGPGDKGANTVAGYHKGGGAIKISVNGTMTHNGVIQSNGQPARMKLFDFTRNGGGAGGSIWVNATTLAGSGSMKANGGTYPQIQTYTSLGRGGLGGRVYVTATNSTYTGQLQAYGGAHFKGFGSGDNGSVIYQNESYTSGTAMGGSVTGCPLPGVYLSDLTIDSTCTLLPGTYNVTGNVTIGTGSPITVTAQGDMRKLLPNYGGVKFITTGNFTVASNATLTANGQGFGPQMGGSGQGADNHNGAGGAGYCGAGGHGSVASGGTAYGDANAPIDLGASGGNDAWSGGGKGGGSIWVAASNTITINGTVTANGTASITGGGGPGGASGGSIYLMSDILTGTGLIRSNGGAGTGVAQFFGGGGSAGRVKLSANTNTFTGTKQTNGGSASPIVGGQVGSSCTVVETTNPQVCGNGLLEGIEACDDGNTSNNDGCNAACSALEYTVTPAGTYTNVDRGSTNNYASLSVVSTSTNPLSINLSTSTNGNPATTITNVYKDTDANCGNGGLTLATNPVTFTTGTTHLCVKFDVTNGITQSPQPKVIVSTTLPAAQKIASLGQGETSIMVYPKRATFSGDTTDFTTVTNLTSAPTIYIHQPGVARVHWLNAVYAAFRDFDADVVLDSHLVSMNITNLGGTYDTPATIDMALSGAYTCSNFGLYYKAGTATTSTDAVSGATIVANETSVGGTCANTSICTNVTCVGSTLTFTAQHFDTFAVGPSMALGSTAPVTTTSGSSGPASTGGGGGAGGSSSGGSSTSTASYCSVTCVPGCPCWGTSTYGIGGTGGFGTSNYNSQIGALYGNIIGGIGGFFGSGGGGSGGAGGGGGIGGGSGGTGGAGGGGAGGFGGGSIGTGGAGGIGSGGGSGSGSGGGGAGASGSGGGSGGSGGWSFGAYGSGAGGSGIGGGSGGAGGSGGGGAGGFGGGGIGTGGAGGFGSGGAGGGGSGTGGSGLSSGFSSASSGAFGSVLGSGSGSGGSWGLGSFFLPPSASQIYGSFGIGSGGSGGAGGAGGGVAGGGTGGTGSSTSSGGFFGSLFGTGGGSGGSVLGALFGSGGSGGAGGTGGSGGSGGSGVGGGSGGSGGAGGGGAAGFGGGSIGTGGAGGGVMGALYGSIVGGGSGYLYGGASTGSVGGGALGALYGSISGGSAGFAMGGGSGGAGAGGIGGGSGGAGGSGSGGSGGSGGAGGFGSGGAFGSGGSGIGGGSGGAGGSGSGGSGGSGGAGGFGTGGAFGSGGAGAGGIGGGSGGAGGSGSGGSGGSGGAGGFGTGGSSASGGLGMTGITTLPGFSGAGSTTGVFSLGSTEGLSGLLSLINTVDPSLANSIATIAQNIPDATIEDVLSQILGVPVETLLAQEPQTPDQPQQPTIDSVTQVGSETLHGSAETKVEYQTCQGSLLSMQLGTVEKQSIATLCGSPLTQINVLGRSPMQVYVEKYSEYVERNFLPPAEPAYNTIGVRDSDRDGLSDLIEVTIQTNPFVADSDDDGFNDNEEHIFYQTNPNNPTSVPSKKILITNIQDKAVVHESKPLIIGVASPAAEVRVSLQKANQVVAQGRARADALGKWVFQPTQAVVPGEYLVIAEEVSNNISLSKDVKNITLILDDQMKAPVITKIVVTDGIAKVYGETERGTTVQGYFASLLQGSSLIADTDAGTFVILSPNVLEKGEHTVYLTATRPDGRMSPSTIAPFVVKDDRGGQTFFGLPLWMFWPLSLLSLMGIILFWMKRHPRRVIYKVTAVQLRNIVESMQDHKEYVYLSPLYTDVREKFVQELVFGIKDGDTAVVCKIEKRAYSDAHGTIDPSYKTMYAKSVSIHTQFTLTFMKNETMTVLERRKFA